ncbi:hypothetical protein SS50377_25986 [Spironucleus salmonicida]|uniref:Uncharacterized protein n=1 Tax=Spironucleus salmonicida TaxID=348837 RepID=V6LG29_9EUKA|nr:hypothetical protein SS50377_25986 [Spironucleus salmonicida]|eukprot:EST43228.1 Hypothetical protein SS50377_17093 [Spironucleus salmonicida]
MQPIMRKSVSYTRSRVPSLLQAIGPTIKTAKASISLRDSPFVHTLASSSLEFDTIHKGHIYFPNQQSNIVSITSFLDESFDHSLFQSEYE